MEFEYRKYKETIFPIREIEITNRDKTTYFYVGSETMQSLLIDEDGTPVDEYAQSLDEEICYYIPHEELVTLTDKQILDYIYYHIDSEVFDL